MHKWLLMLGLVGASIAVRAAEPVVAGEWRQSLDGVWQFTIDAAIAAPAATVVGTWDAITVPGNWDVQEKYGTHKGKGWYRRAFNVPADWKGKHIRLRFAAVYHDAVVTMNGKELGTHNGGYTPFEFDVTDKLDYTGSNTVTICADNSYQRGAWWHWGGISRSVNLIANNDVRIVWQHIRAEPDLSAGTARIFVSYKLVNAGDAPLKVHIASSLDGVAESALAREVAIPARSETVVEADTVLPRERVRLWHIDQPNLYRLTTQLAVDGKVLHEKSDRFGIRKIELTKDSLLLNGERVRLCGYNRVSDSRKFGNTEPDALVKGDVDLMKRANGNLTRLMHVAQAPNLLDYLDEKGMLIWCEIPVWGSDDPQVKNPDNPLTRQWTAETIERDYNHPCIIGWSVGNELAHHYRYVEAMVKFTQALDPHRIVTHVSNTGARKDYNPSNDPLTLSPILLYNTYSPGRDSSAVLHEKWPDKPLFYSEFGIKQFGGNLDARINGLEEMFRKHTAGKPYVVGVSLWTFNDYRSGYKGTPVSGNREWGIVDEQRRPKAAYEQLRKLFSPVHALTLADGSIRVEPRSPDEVPSYTLRGYQVKWTRLDAAGAVLKSGLLTLPELKPGAVPWTAPLPAAPTAGKTATVKLTIVTPTGYEVCDWTGAVNP